MPDEDSRRKMLQRRSLLYDGILRNQLHVPSIDSALCTHHFLNDVFDGKVFVWKMKEVRNRTSVSCPGIHELQKMTINAINDACKDEACN